MGYLEEDSKQDNPSKSYFAVIPANVRYDKNITANAKLLYGEITALCNEKGYCWASNNYFATLYDASKSTISRWISSLCEAGYITVDIIYKPNSKEISSRRIRIAEHTYAQNNQGVCSEISRGMLNNEAYNNTTNKTNEYTISKDIVRPAQKSSSNISPLIQPNNKKSKQTKKLKDDATMKGMIYSFTSNEEIQDKLFEYYSIRGKKDLVPAQWQIILNTLREATNGQTNLAIEMINNAIAGGYKQIVYKSSNLQAPNKQARFDNTAGREIKAIATMSEQEKREFDENLARDENGELMKF